MKTKYNIDEKFVFSPKDNALVDVDNNKLSILGTNETHLLEYIIERRNTTITRQELIVILWNNRDIYVDDSSLTQSVSTLRKALGDSTKLPRFIKTVPKVGYKFIAPANRINITSTKQSFLYKEKASGGNSEQDYIVKGTLTPQFLTSYRQLFRFEVFVLSLILLLMFEFFHFA